MVGKHPKAPLTYDYEGEPYPVDGEEKQRAKPYMLRTGMGALQKKLKDGYAFA